MNDAVKETPQDVRGLFATEQDVEVILRKLRADGYSRIDCIRFLFTERNLGLAEGKKIVHFSEAWSDLRDAHDAFLDSLEKTLQDMLDSESEP